MNTTIELNSMSAKPSWITAKIFVDMECTVTVLTCIITVSYKKYKSIKFFDHGLLYDVGANIT